MGREVPVKAGKWTGRGLSGAALKRFAVISMFADHFAVVFLENGLLYRMDRSTVSSCAPEDSKEVKRL